MTQRETPDTDTRLEALLRADRVPDRDALFRIAVLQRRERQRFRRELAAALTVGLVTTVAQTLRTPFARIARSLSRSFGG